MIRVKVMDDYFDGSLRLVIAEIMGNGRLRVMMQDGQWLEHDEATLIPPDAGFRVPRAAAQPMVEAIQSWQGMSKPMGPETVEVMREALEVERRRVDNVLQVLSGGAS